MQRANRDILIGLLAVSVFSLAVIWLSSRDAESAAAGDTIRVTAAFNKVDGMLPGDEVRLSGVRVGVVESQRLDENFKAVLTLSIDKRVVLPTDTSAAIHTNGLFGSKFIVLEPGGEFDELVDGDTITFTQDSLVVEDLLDLIIAEGNARRAAAEN